MNNDRVVHAFQMVMSVPLAPDDKEEYLQMKHTVLNCLAIIAEAGKLEVELNQALENITAIVKGSEFRNFINEYHKAEKGKKDHAN
jgi:hypothetical protein